MATYATWNPSDKGTHAVLSNGNLSLGNNAGGQYTSVRSTIGVSSGKWYWEITRTASMNLDTLYGVANSSATLNNFVGSDANGWGYFESSQKYNNNTGTAYGANYGDGDTIGVALDMDAGTLVFYLNNSSQGTAFTGLTGTIYAMCSNQTGSGTPTVNANFGATALTYSPPAGYNAGLYTASVGGWNFALV